MGIVEQVLESFGIRDQGFLPIFAASLLVVQLFLVHLLLVYVIFKRLQRRWDRRNNQARELEYRRMILDFLGQHIEHGSFDLTDFKKKLKSKKERGFLRRVLITQIRALRDKERRVLGQLYEALGFFDEDVKLARSWWWSNRLEAVVRMGQVQVPKAGSILEESLSDKNELVSLAAMKSLSYFDYPNKAKIILDSLGRRAPARRDLFEDVLRQIGRDDPSQIIDYLLECFDPEVAAICVSVLGRLGIQDSLPLLMDLTKSSSDQVVAECAQSLGLIGSLESIDVLREMLQHESPLVRAQSMRSLAGLGDKIDFKAIKLLQMDDSVEVRRAAFDALKKGSG